MFELTDEAADLIHTLIHNAGMRPGSGLRMTLEPAVGSLVMSLATQPAAADTVYTARDAHVFVAPPAATRLAGYTLDAHNNDDRCAFFLRDR